MLDLCVWPRLLDGVLMKLRDFIRFLWALLAAVGLLGLLLVRVTGCAPTVRPTSPAAQAPLSGPVTTDCRADGWSSAAQANAASLQTLAWAPFGRTETGWEVYVTLIQFEIGSACAPGSEGFARALADWQRQNGQTPDGILSDTTFAALKGAVQTRRDFVRLTAGGVCPDTPDLITAARIEEGYAGKAVWLRPGALEAYRRMVATAKAEEPDIAADPRNLTIFSGYRSPAADAARCQAEGNCDGVARARCSAHRTGLAVDLYVGQAPGYGPDSTADPNRLAMSRTPTYRWLVANARRFGFVNYPFEPWHWEWTGESP